MHSAREVSAVIFDFYVTVTGYCTFGGPRVVEATLVLQRLEEERNLRLLDPHRQNRPPSGLGRWVIIWWYSAERRASQLRQGKPRD